MNKPLYAPACILLLLCLATGLHAVQVHSPADGFSLLRESRPWLQGFPADATLLPLDLVATHGDEDLVLGVAGATVAVAPDSLVLLVEVRDELSRIRLLYGSMQVRMSEETASSRLVVELSDIAVDLSRVDAVVTYSHANGGSVHVSGGIAEAVRALPDESDDASVRAFATPRRTLYYAPEQGVFSAVPLTPVAAAETPAGEDLLPALETFRARYDASRIYRDFFDEAFERDRAGLPTGDVSASAADAVRETLAASFPLFALFHDALGPDSVVEALMRRVPARPSPGGTDSPGSRARQEIARFFERFSAVAYQARIAGVYTEAP